MTPATVPAFAPREAPPRAAPDWLAPSPSVRDRPPAPLRFMPTPFFTARPPTPRLLVALFAAALPASPRASPISAPSPPTDSSSKPTRP